VVGGLVVLVAPLIARYGLAAGAMPQEAVIAAIRWMGVSLAGQWTSALYINGFIGLQRQDALSVIRLVAATAHAVGLVLVLWIFSPSAGMYFAFSALGAALASVAFRICLWRVMPKGVTDAVQPHVDFAQLSRLWRYSAGSLLIGLSSALLIQAPTLIVAKFYSLSQLAAFTLSVGLASQISVLTQPIVSSLVPYFTQVLASGDKVLLAREYHRWTQVVVAVVMPVAATLIVFARPLMDLWLGADAPLVAGVASLLPWIVAGTVLNTFVMMPYVLQIAYGWTRLSVASNAIAVALLVPTLVLLVPRYGPITAAIGWMAIYLAYYVVQVPIMHRLLLPKELASWWMRDTLVPGATVMVLYGVAYLALPVGWPAWYYLPVIGVMALVATGALLVVLPSARADVLQALRLLRGSRFVAENATKRNL
jgi:O-antigen/teichoic acid export membrane protein